MKPSAYSPITEEGLSEDSMADNAAALVEDEDFDEGEQEAARPERHNGRPMDAFDKAALAAEKELGDEDDPDSTKPKAKTKPKEEKKPAPKAKPDEKPSKDAAKPAKKPAEAEEDDSDEDEGETDAKPKAKAPAGPLEAKKYWAKDRREAFAYQPDHVKQAWLEEEPIPVSHWPDENKAAFAKMPREAKELVLEQNSALERGFGQRFEALAAERKLAETIRAAPTPQQRAAMQARGLDEPKTFSALLRAQEHSAQDPVGYVRDFIMRNKINPRTILGDEAGGGENGQQAPQQADIDSHPAMRAMKAEMAALKQGFAAEQQRREQAEDVRIGAEMQAALSEKDEAGEARYPFIRLVHNDMAQILVNVSESDPERFAAMGIKDRMAEAYTLALERFPELQQTQRKARPAPVDEPDDEDADPEAETEAERLKKATSKKTRTPQSAPASGRKDDAFARASAKAERQLGNHR